MYSSAGRATVKLFPQFQGEVRLKTKDAPYLPPPKKTERKTKKQEKPDDFFFYNILDYNEEATQKLKKSSYIPVSQAPPVGKYKPRYRSVHPENYSSVAYHPPVRPSESHMTKRKSLEKAKETQRESHFRSTHKEGTDSGLMKYTQRKWTDVRVPNFSRMKERNLFPKEERKSESKDKEKEATLDSFNFNITADAFKIGGTTKASGFNTQKSLPSLKRPKKVPGIAFEKQTKRKGIGIQGMGSEPGIKYTKTDDNTMNSRGFIDFSKTSGREQFDSKNTSTKDSKKIYKYFNRQSSTVHTSTVNFNTMTGRDTLDMNNDVYYTRRDVYMSMSIHDILQDNMNLILQ